MEIWALFPNLLRDSDNIAGIGDNSTEISYNSAGIGDNSAEVGDDTAACRDRRYRHESDPMLNSTLNGDWSNFVHGRQFPKGECISMHLP